jgi:hypothetical protein
MTRQYAFPVTTGGIRSGSITLPQMSLSEAQALKEKFDADMVAQGMPEVTLEIPHDIKK